MCLLRERKMGVMGFALSLSLALSLATLISRLDEALP
jgi:hypothetical protein